MYATLFKHKWKQTLRSGFMRQNWGVKILLGFLVLYFGLIFLALGILMPELLEEIHGEGDVLGYFAQYVFYYILVDIAARYMLQDLTVLSVQQYLILPVRKSKLLHFLLQSSIFNFFNLLPLLFVIPFAFRGVAPAEGVIQAVLFSVGMLGVVLCDHYLAIYLKRIAAVKFYVFLLALVVIAGLLVGQNLNWWSLYPVSRFTFGPLAQNYYAWLVPLLPLASLYRLNYAFLKRFTHLDQWQKQAKEVSENRFAYLEKKGLYGAMVANELKLITRNKRTKGVLFSGLFLAAYGLIFYGVDTYREGYGWLLFAGIFMTGVMMINYGQFLVSWESSYFDGILTRNFSVKQYYRGKFWLLATMVLVMYIITLPYAFFGLKALWINTAAMFYNLGVSTVILLFASTYTKKPIDLSKGAAFNYQGTSATQFVITVPLLLVPILLFQGFNLLGAPIWGLVTIGSLGLINLAFLPYYLQETAKNFKEKKYQKAAGYRQK
jgi:hypothetical protein